MSRKDYEAVAKEIKEARENTHDRETLDILAHKLGLMFLRDNARFDKSRFLHACGIFHTPWRMSY